MKKIIRFVCAMTLILSVALSVPVSASAEVNNTIKTKTTEVTQQKKSGPGPELIIACGDDKNIKMPNAKSYLDEHTPLFVDAPKGHSVNAYTHPDLNNDDAKLMPYAYHGSQFIALAAENGFVCGIYISDKNEYRAAWVDEDHLSSEFPGTDIYVGNFNKAKSYKVFSVASEWSKLAFVGTKTKYSNVLNCPDKLDGIVIEYQVISRNGKGDVSGMRDVYINDGSGWELVTSYDLDPYNQTVRVLVMFDEPTEVKAVATIPQDADLEGFVFRQTIPMLIYTK